MQVFFKNYTYFALPCSGLGLVGLALYLVDWPTIVLQCFDTVGSVIWPVEIVPDMTYNMFGGTLNPTLLWTDLLYVSWDVKLYSLTPRVINGVGHDVRTCVFCYVITASCTLTQLDCIYSVINVVQWVYDVEVLLHVLWLRTPLMLTASRGHVDMTSFLVSALADVNAVDVYQRTTLHMVVWRSAVCSAH